MGSSQVTLVQKNKPSGQCRTAWLLIRFPLLRWSCGFGLLALSGGCAATGAEALVGLHFLLVDRLGSGCAEGRAGGNDPVFVLHLATVASTHFDAGGINALAGFALRQVGLGINCALRSQFFARLLTRGVFAHDDCLGFRI